MHKLSQLINVLIPEEVRPVLATVSISALDVEMCLKIVSLALSTIYLVWRWRNEVKQLKNKK